MPLYNVFCSKCGYMGQLLAKKVWTQMDARDLICPGCDKYLLLRCGKGPTTNVKEKLDNGVMVRAVERYADAEELFHERAKNADPNAGKANRT